MIADGRVHETWELRKDWCRQMHDDWEARRSTLDEKFVVDGEVTRGRKRYVHWLVEPRELVPLAQELRADQIDTYVYSADASRPESLTAAFDAIKVEHGSIDVLVYNAAFMSSGVHVGIVEIMGIVGIDEHFAPYKIAEAYWTLHVERDRVEYIFD